MKPKTKLQIEVDALHKCLPPLTDNQIDWITRHFSSGVAYNSGKMTWCCECGQSYESTGSDKDTCPHCGAKVKVRNFRYRSHESNYYFQLAQHIGDWQVLRYYIDIIKSKKGEMESHEVIEIAQDWFNINGGQVAYQKLRPMMCYSKYPVNLYSPLEMRSSRTIGIGLMPVCIGSTIHPAYRKLGISAHFHGVYTHKLFSSILSYPFVETLLKSREYHLLDHASYYPTSFEKWWPVVKIALRHGYKIKDWDTYSDYLRDLEFLKKDLHNPSLICPADLQTAHEHYAKLADNKREADILKKRLAFNSTYVEQKGKYFGLCIADENIEITPFKSVKEFKTEAHKLRQCLWTGEYFKKEKSLILSAKIGGKSIETIELDLESYKVLQCHGFKNKNTKYHKRILNLVQSGIPQIQKCNQLAVSHC